jgi:uncharacterized spore protein YtfJ
MKIRHIEQTRLIFLIPVLLLLAGCAAGDTQFTQETPAGFWYGLWQGIISVLALIIHIFNDNVAVYEVNNSGGWYDFGFLLGIILVWGGSSHAHCKTRKEKQREQEWKEIGDKVEIKVMRKLKEWAEDEETGTSTNDWDEIGEKVEKKLKRKIREWAEKE